MRYFQDAIPGNHCFGCGPDNPHGLQIKSHWLDDGRSECLFTPKPHHCAGPKEYVNGGIISSLIDCHCICTAIAEGYRAQNREIGSGDTVWYVTGSLQVSYLKPTPIDSVLRVIARIEEKSERKMTLCAEVSVDQVPVATGEVLAVRVEAGW